MYITQAAHSSCTTVGQKQNWFLSEDLVPVYVYMDNRVLVRNAANEHVLK